MKISKFQIITLALFVIFLVGGVAAFALYKGDTTDNTLPPVTLWGTFPADVFDQYVSAINSKLAQSISVTYVQVNPTTFSQEFVSALARGTGPDGLLIPVDMLLPHYDKLALIPFEALPQRDFINSYIEEANIYLYNDGILALPFTVDPLVMYWNRDTFNAAGLATYPQFWDEFNNLNTKLTVKDQQGNIRKSAVALGDFTNLSNAREILGSLILQLNNPVTQKDSDGFARSTLKSTATYSPLPAINFFTQFSNPTSPNYSWNRGLPASKAAFLSGMLATYFGFASEIADIRSKNPNLNFDVAPLPQVRSGGIKAAYARMNGFSIVRSSANPNVVYQVISILTDPANLPILNDQLYIPSVHRPTIARGSSDPYITIFNQAALISRTWIDADPIKSRAIMATMIEAILSGSKSDFAALQDAGEQYDIMLEQAVR
jgi:ABC-type glycerol-3-phosphate transport system substrate-binding protein